MRIKTDENIGKSGVDILRQHNHDVATVREQQLGGSSDETVFRVCQAEQRVLLTLDRDFGQVPRFPPKDGAGIVILELGGPASSARLNERLRDFLRLSQQRSVKGELWIVEPGRVRVHLAKDDADPAHDD